jgi:hypothetical protein
MKRTIVTLALVASAVTLGAATKKDTIRRTFANAAGRTVEVDNVFGSITVTAHNANTVEMVANQDFRADDDTELQQALREVRLDITETATGIRIYVDGPFRDRHDRDHRRRDQHWRPLYDFELKVPAQTALKLRTVTDGDVHVTGVSGAYEVSNVNGHVDLTDIGGAGSAVTVNGPIHATFRSLPTGDLRFKTVNGSLETTFPTGLNADAHVKTMNGDLYTDFEVTRLANKPVVMEAHGSRRSWRGDHGGSVRIGNGGPELSYETINGDVRIAKR